MNAQTLKERTVPTDATHCRPTMWNQRVKRYFKFKNGQWYVWNFTKWMPVVGRPNGQLKEIGK